MKNTQRQPRPSVSTPPRVGPRAGPTSTTSPNTPWAMPCRLRGTERNRMAWAMGISPPPSPPCSSRATTSSGRLGASPQSSEAAVNPSSDIRK